MKKINFVSIISIVILVSCSSEFFDEYPEDQLTPEIFYKTETDFELAINAAYISLRSTYEYFFVLGDISSDDTYNWKGNNNFDIISINESNVSNNNGLLETHWNSCYATIARCNIVLGRIENASLNNAIKERIIGEARFLRALAYFDLVRIFGDVPLVISEIKTAGDAFSYSRTNYNEVYNFIEAELIIASSLLPESYSDINWGRATNIAAKSILGKVYLTRNKYNESAEILDAVIKSGSHILLNDYEQVFDPDNINNSEIIFAVQYGRNMSPKQGSSFGNRVAPNEPVDKVVVALGTGHGMFHITDDLKRQFVPTDKRFKMVDSATAQGSQRKYFFTKKYFDSKMVQPQDAANDWIIVRYADVILMMSEALNELGRSSESTEYLNLVRSRAGLDLVGANVAQEDLRALILQERRIELNCEGQRWFDLLRSGKIEEVMNKHFADSRADVDQVGINSKFESHEIIFPIPTRQIFLNPDKITQNLGY